MGRICRCEILKALSAAADIFTFGNGTAGGKGDDEPSSPFVFFKAETYCRCGKVLYKIAGEFKAYVHTPGDELAVYDPLHLQAYVIRVEHK